MDITQLESFRTIAQCESLTKAAKQAHVSQPAMSAMLKRLEDELEIQLFDRTANRIVLNQAGKIALNYTNNILRNYREMKTELKQYTRYTSQLSIAFCDPGMLWLCIPKFPNAYPDIKVSSCRYTDYSLHNAINSLLYMEYDVMVTPFAVTHAAIKSVPFLTEQVHLSVPSNSPITLRNSISLRELEPQPFLFPDFGGYNIYMIKKLLNKTSPGFEMIEDNFLVIQQMIRDTDYLTTASPLTFYLRSDGERRVLIPLSDPELHFTYHITYLRKNKEKVQPFLDWTNEYLEKTRRT